METLIFIVVISLLMLAVVDIIVGVSNDAINFLNASLGSKAFNFKTIMIIASAGIFVGAVFSSGMMEVARKGIFHPQMFSFYDILVIFVAVLIGDILLLNIFNSMGMPTSTTVSIVFNLLGAAVAIGFANVIGDDKPIADLALYINSSKALTIIFGILLSVVVAFTVGAIAQYFSRLVFTFRYDVKTRAVSTAIFAGISIAAITYFIVLKGLKGTDFYGDIKVILKNYTLLIIGGSFLFWTLISYVTVKFFNANILKFIILLGTFSLALAFAGNDLVNFIGVPIAAFNSWQFWIDAGAGDPHIFMMADLGKKVPTPLLFLLASGAIMIATLWLSKKAKNVAKTTLDLTAQGDKEEKFSSNLLSRAMVRGALKVNHSLQAMIPSSTRQWMDSRFQIPAIEKSNAEAAEFDLIRASVNLLIAAILISIGTSFKLPLSTTYITFMVAMGASLSDRAWGRESAVYRIAGVMNVIAGWFLTALSAFIIAFTIAMIIYNTGFVIALVMEVGVLYLMYRNRTGKKLDPDEMEDEMEVTKANQVKEINEIELIQKSSKQIHKVLQRTNNYLKQALEGAGKTDVRFGKPLMKDVEKLNAYTKKRKDRANKVLLKLTPDAVEAGPFYVQMLDTQREISLAVLYAIKPIVEHITNSHTPLIQEQIDELTQLHSCIIKFSDDVLKAIDTNDFSSRDELNERMEKIIKQIDDARRNQVKRVKEDIVGVRNSMLYFNILQEMKNINLYTMSLFKSYRDFMEIVED
jgi:phosphate/sulfate permease